MCVCVCVCVRVCVLCVCVCVQADTKARKARSTCHGICDGRAENPAKTDERAQQVEQGRCATGSRGARSTLLCVRQSQGTPASSQALQGRDAAHTTTIPAHIPAELPDFLAPAIIGNLAREVRCRRVVAARAACIHAHASVITHTHTRRV